MQGQTTHWGKCPCHGDAPEGWGNSAWWGLGSASQVARYACIHQAQDEQSQGLHDGQERVRVLNLSEEGSTGGKSGFCITCPTHEVVPRVESHSGDGGQMGTPICGGEQTKLLEKLNLDGLSNWTPRNATVAQHLVLAFHDIFALEGSELGCTSAI